jgi:hypothetical protein
LGFNIVLSSVFVMYSDRVARRESFVESFIETLFELLRCFWGIARFNHGAL